MHTITVPVSRVAMKSAALTAAGISGKAFGTLKLGTRVEANRKAALKRGTCKHKHRAMDY